MFDRVLPSFRPSGVPRSSAVVVVGAAPTLGTTLAGSVGTQGPSTTCRCRPRLLPAGRRSMKRAFTPRSATPPLATPPLAAKRNHARRSKSGTLIQPRASCAGSVVPVTGVW